MTEEIFKLIEISHISKNPLDPRPTVTGPEFDLFRASVKERGVIQPILVRTKDGKLELVAGKRRLKAAELEGLTSIPAVVRELSDQEAYDLMMIENLQRKDLTELEEARSFKDYLSRNGQDALTDLASRLNLSPSYIHRRIAVLALPKQILKAWDKGLLRYGHLEQLMRLADKETILEYFKQIYDRNTSVSALKSNIDRKAPELKMAKFPLEEAGCTKCFQNSEVQKDLFEDFGNLGKAHCLDPKCFKQHQETWLTTNWKKTGYYRTYRTNGFRFYEDTNWDDYHHIHGNTPDTCKVCEKFVTILTITGNAHVQRGCVGDKACYQKSTKTKSERKETTRGGWHGEFFREKFYAEQIPEKMKQVGASDSPTLKLTLATLIHSNRDLGGWFKEKIDGPQPESNYYSWISNEKTWEAIEGMTDTQVADLLKEASTIISLQQNFGSKTRHLVGRFLGLDLAREWKITEEYLKKKTIKEIISMGEKLKVFKDPVVKTYLVKTLKKKADGFDKCKKSELIDLFMKSGIDLTGKVPEEIVEVK